ncbi:MAG: hypothetical protein JO263_02615, partial [Candidatus Eremiobacteraeota bacterium]|nr:hypothetical protein [Candidatus Eremiobacteraeota bacterium]
MFGPFVRVLACGIAASVVGVCSAAARADGTQDVYARGIVSGANQSIKNLLDSQKAQQKVSQAPPVSQQRTGPKMELPGNRIE